MDVNGLRKMSLLDYPGKVACTVFIAGCNMRCPFCHNAPLVLAPSESETIGEKDLLSFLKKRKNLLDGVCITGGEPTLRRELPGLMRSIKDLGYAVKLDTNGTNPDMLRALIDGALVDYIAMDIKNSPSKYPGTVGVPDFDITPVLRSAELLIELGGGGFDYEFRTTAVGGLHTAADFAGIGRWLAGAKRYFIQNFVDSGDLITPGIAGCTAGQMHEYLDEIKKYIPAAALRGI